MSTPGALSVSASEAGTKVCVQGDVTEAMDFSRIVGTQGPELVMDLRELRRINSGGVHNWLRLMEELAENGKRVYFEWAPEPFLSQMAMIPNFEGHGELRSVQLTYRCPDCDSSETCFYKCDPNGAPAKEIQGPMCKLCGIATEMDALLESLQVAGLSVVGAPQS